jgi:cobalt/nickel transport system permease protein
MELFSEYFRKGHFLAKIDGRIKLIVVLMLLVMVLSSKHISFPLLIAAFCLLLCLRMRIPYRVMLVRFSQPLFIAFIVFFLKLFFTGQEPLFSFSCLGIEVIAHREGLIEGFTISSRIISAVSLLIVLSFATPFTEFITSLAWFRVPRQFVELLMFSYRYIFLLLEDAMVIYNAQKNRLGYSGIRRGLNSFGILSGSLTLRAFEHSQTITSAMIQRGYTGDIPMTLHRPLKKREVTIAILLIVALGILWKI